MFHKYCDNAGYHGRGSKKLPNWLGDILDLRMALHRNRKMMSKDGHRILSIGGTEETVVRIATMFLPGLL